MVDQAGAVNYPGEATISQLTISSFANTSLVDISGIYLEFSITEEIFKPYMYGNITIKDTIGLMSNFPILGEEILNIKFSTKLRPDITKSYTFIIYAVREPMLDDNGSSMIYTLDFVSVEAATTAMQIISANFTGAVNDIVSTILKGNQYIGTSKSISVQQTAGVVSYTVPKKTPFEIIDFMRNRAIAPNTNDSNYFLFFENSDGYTFTTLTNLINTSLAKKKLIDASNTSSSNLNFGDIRHIPVANSVELHTKNLTEGAFARYKNTFDNFRSGAYNSTVNVFDVNQRSYNTFNQKYRDTFALTTHIDPTSNTSYKQSNTFLNLYETLPTAVKFMVLDSSQMDFNNIPRQTNTRLQHFLMFDENPFIGTIYGDPMIVAGDIYHLVLPEFSSNSDKMYEDAYLSGNYMIGRIVHNVQLAKYNMQLHCYKDSYKTPIAPNPWYLQEQSTPSPVQGPS